MKTHIKHEYGDWIVFVDDNPKFAFTYKEEAKIVRNMIDALSIVYDEFGEEYLFDSSGKATAMACVKHSLEQCKK